MRTTLLQRQARARAVHGPGDEGDNNKEGGEDCCDELSDDDGRYDDGGDHKGDWGSHGSDDHGKG